MHIFSDIYTAATDKANRVPCEQKFLSCMAFSVNEVIRVSSVRVVGLFRSRSVLNQLRDRQDTRMTLLTLKAMQERNLCFAR